MSATFLNSYKCPKHAWLVLATSATNESLFPRSFYGWYILHLIPTKALCAMSGLWPLPTVQSFVPSISLLPGESTIRPTTVPPLPCVWTKQHTFSLYTPQAKGSVYRNFIRFGDWLLYVNHQARHTRPFSKKMIDWLFALFCLFGILCSAKIVDILKQHQFKNS